MWWCKKYNKPLKDPILMQYSVEELLYEMMSHRHYDNDLNRQRQEEADRIEIEKYDEDVEWAEEMERLEAEKLKQDTKPPTSPAEAPHNQEWMQQIIEEEKKKFGDDFGEDISFNMDE
jgi:hypothetical protein